MAQMCPAKSTIVPFKKQMYSSGSIILSYIDDKCICVSIHAPTRGATELIVSKADIRLVSIHAPTRGATPTDPTPGKAQTFQSTHPRGVRQGDTANESEQPGFNPRTHEGCDYRVVVLPVAPLTFQSTHPRGVRQLGATV